MCIQHKNGERLYVNIAFIPVCKPHKHKLYSLRHCTNIVYIIPRVVSHVAEYFESLKNGSIIFI